MGDETLYLHLAQNNENITSYRLTTREMGQEYRWGLSVCGVEGCVDLIREMEESEGSWQEENFGLHCEMRDIMEFHEAFSGS